MHLKTRLLQQFSDSYQSLVKCVYGYRRKLNNRINKIHRIVNEECYATFEELLTKDRATTIHESNIQMLAIEMYKVIKGHSPEIMKEVFQLKERDIYHSNFPFKSRNVKTVSYVTQSLGHLCPNI